MNGLRKMNPLDAKAIDSMENSFLAGNSAGVAMASIAEAPSLKLVSREASP